MRKIRHPDRWGHLGVAPPSASREDGRRWRWSCPADPVRRRVSRCGIEGEPYPEWPSLPHPELSWAPTVQEVVERSDQLLYFSHHSYDHVVRFLTEAALDPAVDSIRLTIYRVSRESAVLRALLEAASRGKDVRVFVEAKARFDEEANLEWAERLEAAGIVTHYSFPDLKVHAKAALVVSGSSTSWRGGTRTPGSDTSWSPHSTSGRASTT